MNACPICQTAYEEAQAISCHTCGWDLTPYPLTFTGTIPDAYILKERAKLKWAQEVWIGLQQLPSQAGFEQLQQEKAVLTESGQQLESQVNHLIGEKQNLSAQISQLEQERSHLQNQNAHLVQEKSELVNRLTSLEVQVQKVIQEREQFLQKIDSLEQAKSHSQKVSAAFTQEKQDLLEQNKLLRQENSELQLQLNRERVQLRAALTKTEAKLVELEQQNHSLKAQHQQTQSGRGQSQQELRLITDSGVTITHYLTLSGRHASHPGDYFHSRENCDQLRNQLQEKYGRKINDGLLDRIIREWVEDIKLGNRPTTIEMK